MNGNGNIKLISRLIDRQLPPCEDVKIVVARDAENQVSAFDCDGNEWSFRSNPSLWDGDLLPQYASNALAQADPNLAVGGFYRVNTGVLILQQIIYVKL